MAREGALSCSGLAWRDRLCNPGSCYFCIWSWLAAQLGRRGRASRYDGARCCSPTRSQEAWEVVRTAKSSRVTSSCVQKRDEKMRRTLIPGRRDGRQWVAGRGVSTSQPSGRVTVRPTRQDLYQSRARKVPVAVSREVLCGAGSIPSFSALDAPYSYSPSRCGEATRKKTAEVTTAATIMSFVHGRSPRAAHDG